MPDDAPFGSLDFLYVPSRDVAEDLRWFGEVLGGRVVFAIDSMGTRVAAVELSAGPPLVLLTDHLEGDRPILVYRVPDLDEALGTLEGRGWRREHLFEIPQGRSVRSRARAGIAWRCSARPTPRSRRTSRGAVEGRLRPRDVPGRSRDVRMPSVFTRYSAKPSRRATWRA